MQKLNSRTGRGVNAPGRDYLRGHCGHTFPPVSRRDVLQKAVNMTVTEELVEAVWNKGRIVPGNDSRIWRKDSCNAWIRRNQYGNRDSEYGWEIDHIDPNGGDNLSNLQPLQWENNVAKSDGLQVCVVTANGTQNARP